MHILLIILATIIYWVRYLFRNSYKNKLKALLDGLETQSIDKLLKEGKTGDFRNYGKAYFKAAHMDEVGQFDQSLLDKPSCFPDGTWVKCKTTGAVRYVTRQTNKDCFEDDGELSGKPSATLCHNDNYQKFITPMKNQTKL